MNRIPDLTVFTPEAFQIWSDRMAELDLLYHFEDSPDDQIDCKSGDRTFNDAECRKLGLILNLASDYGIDIMEHALNSFHKFYLTKGE